MNHIERAKARRRAAWGSGRVLVTRESTPCAKWFRRLHAVTFTTAEEAKRAATGAKNAGSSYVVVR